MKNRWVKNAFSFFNTPVWPATILRKHPDTMLFLDMAAASLIEKE